MATTTDNESDYNGSTPNGWGWDPESDLNVAVFREEGHEIARIDRTANGFRVTVHGPYRTLDRTVDTASEATDMVIRNLP